MQSIEQVFNYMKNEIERKAKAEEQAILDEVKALEDEAVDSMRKEAKLDADLKLKQDVEEMTSLAASEISQSHIERTRKLIEKRDTFVKDIFGQARQQLVDFTNQDDYKTFLIEKMKKVNTIASFPNSTLYINKKDEKYKDDLVKCFDHELMIEITPSIHIGGFILENKERSVVLDETLDNALTAQKEWFHKNSGLMIK